MLLQDGSCACLYFLLTSICIESIIMNRILTMFSRTNSLVPLSNSGVLRTEETENTIIKPDTHRTRVTSPPLSARDTNSPPFILYHLLTPCNVL